MLSIWANSSTRPPVLVPVDGSITDQQNDTFRLVWP
jgi:hypothetical protein